MTPSPKDLIVVGGGITGLATAYIAAKAGKKATVLEASDGFGGLLRTFPVGETQLEHYYHHFFTHDAEIHWLIRELGIEDKLIFKPTTMGFFRDGAIHAFNTPMDVLRFKPLGFVAKLRFGLTSLYLGKRVQWRDSEGISAMQWFTKNAGKAATSAIWEPMLRVKFGRYAEKVPLAWMVGRLRQRMNSRSGGDERLGYLDGSLNTLLVSLLAKLRELGVELVANAPVEQLRIEQNRVVGAQAGGTEYLADQVVLTIPSPVVSKLLQPHNTTLAQQIGSVEYFGAVCTILELDRPFSDIYWLNVADAGFPFGGIIEHTNFIEPAVYGGRHIVYLSRYFTHDEAVATMPESELLDHMLEPLPRINSAFTREWIQNSHVFRTRTAATVCDLNFSKKVTPARLSIDGLYLANMVHIYPDERSTNNSIRIAAEVCRVMGIDSAGVPKGNSLSGQLGFDV